ncbi:MAG: hypothetical protein F4X72_14660 [Dehalococcoidia bacterium]|nr:hypothetical protein [Dehalococcoidia bacterium]
MVVVFVLPISYLLPEWSDFRDHPPELAMGIAIAAAVLGGLVFNAGARLRGRKRQEIIRVAQLFIVAVILIILSLPTQQFDDSLNGSEPGSLETGIRGLFFWVAAASYFGGILLFIGGLVDLAFTISATDKGDSAHRGTNGTPIRDVLTGQDVESDAS